MKTLRLQPVIHDSLRMVQRLLGEDIKLDIHLDCPEAFVEGDISRLHQVVMNLVVNARDAMPAGGKLYISLRCLEAEVELEIRDSGRGIDPSLHSRIFEPFFTNKPFGAGTGLGLSTVDGIVSMHKGRIVVDSEPGLGASFKVYLPLCKTGLLDSSGKSKIERPSGAGNILLAEDEDQVRNLIVRLLRSSGFEVTAVENGEKALAALDDSFDLLITDVVMPGMDGGKLAEAVHQTRPELPVLFISGYTDDRLSQFGIQSGECNFLAKPFTSAQLHQTVSSLLESRKTAP